MTDYRIFTKIIIYKYGGGRKEYLLCYKKDIFSWIVFMIFSVGFMRARWVIIKSFRSYGSAKKHMNMLIREQEAEVEIE